MEPRFVLKKIVKFGRKEYYEKKPVSMKVLKMKGTQVFSVGGPLKIMSITRTEDPYFLVLSEYMNEVRIYYFSRKGVLLGAENCEKSLKLFKEVKNSTVVKYKLPKINNKKGK